MAILIRGGLVLAAVDAEPIPQDVLIEGGRIVAVGTDLEPGPDATLLDARDRLIIPGLINAHTHAHNTLARGAVDGLPLELWLQPLAARVAGRTPREIYVGAALGAVEMLKSGTTCACDMAQVLPWATDGTLDAVAQAYADVGARVVIAPQVADLPFYCGLAGLEPLLPKDVLDELAARPPVPRHEVLAVLWRFAGRWHGAADGRINVGVGPTLATVCSRELLEACADLAGRWELTLQTHLAETKGEAYTALAAFGQSFTAYLHELGLLGPRTLLAHGVWIDQNDLELIAASGSSVAHNPVSNLKLGAGLAPVVDLLAHGCNVALGTDGAASSDNLNLFGPLRLAAILARAVEPNYDRWPGAADAFRMATVGGARAAGLAGQVGEIRPGLLADLVLLDLRATYYHPRNSLLEQLVYCEVGSSVRTVLVGGRVVVQDGRLTTLDEDALLAEADEIGQRIATDTGRPGAFARRVLPYVRRAYFEVNRAEWPLNRYASDAYRTLPEA